MYVNSNAQSGQIFTTCDEQNFYESIIEEADQNVLQAVWWLHVQFRQRSSCHRRLCPQMSKANVDWCVCMELTFKRFVDAHIIGFGTYRELVRTHIHSRVYKMETGTVHLSI